MVNSDKSKKSFFFLLFIWVLLTSLKTNNLIFDDRERIEVEEYSEDSVLEQIEKLKGRLVEFQDNNDIENTLKTYKDIGGSYHLLDQFDSAVVYFKKGGELAEMKGHDKLHSAFLYNLGIVYSTIGMYPTALENAREGLEIDKKLDNKPNIAIALNGLAIIYQRWGRYDKAMEYQLESIKLSEDIEDSVGMANGYYNLGSIYCKVEKIDKGLEYFERAQKHYSELIKRDTVNQELKQVLSETLYSIGGVYQHNGELTSALSIYQEALEIKKQTLDKLGMSNVFNRIGTIYLLMENYPLALANLFKSLQFKQLINDKKGMAITFFNIAQVYIEQDNIDKAEKFFKKTEELAKENSDHEILKDTYLMLSEIYDLKNMHHKALEYHKLFSSYADSASNQSTAKIIEELSLKYETERKEKENQLLQRDNEIQALTIKRQKSLSYLLLGIGVMVLIIATVLFILYRSKRRANKIISAKNQLLGKQNIKIANQSKIIELKNRDLTDSIKYAKTIQESMLAQPSELNQTLSDAFILFKPKDIVSGDFYWFGQIHDKFIFSAIDCTGHGVPGAFMSMLGNSYLESIIYKGGVTAPDEILDELNDSVQKSLKQSVTNNQDGMDMAICTIDLKTGIVEFSGARNPLVYIRDNQLVTIKGDRRPIGRSYYGTVNFTKHQIEPGAPTSFYMFSDGYADQFGGTDDRKFKSANLKKLLLRIHEKPMDEQRRILDETIENWKNGQEQIDDILVVGFRLE